MQTQTVVKTIRWISGLLDEETKVILFNWGDMAKDKPIGVQDFISATQNLARASVPIEGNPDAMEVLQAFGLTPLLDKEFIVALEMEGVKGREKEHVDEMLETIGKPWRNMIQCVDPLETLTTPVELRGKEIPAGILSLEVRYSETRRPSVNDLSKATDLLQDAYGAIARVYGKGADSHLTIVKVESGTSIRIDTKGIAESVKHFKDFLIEAWNKLRHKRAEEVVVNNKALLSSLAVVQRIETMKNDGSLEPEEAEKLRRRLIDGAMGLFECGVLLPEIPAHETVDNARLLSGFSPKLLPAPEEKAAPKTKAGKRIKAKGKARKRTKRA